MGLFSRDKAEAILRAAEGEDAGGRQPMTVAQLIGHLSEMPPDTPVIASYDADCAWGDVTGVRQREGKVVLFVD